MSTPSPGGGCRGWPGCGARPPRGRTRPQQYTRTHGALQLQSTVYNLFLIASLLRFSLLAFRFCLVLLLLTLSSTDFFFFLGCESELCMVALAVTGLMGRSYILCSFASFCSISSLSLKCSCCKMEQSKNIHQ